MLFNKYGGENIGVTNHLMHFYMFLRTRYNVKLANENILHAQGISIILFRLKKCPII